MPTYEYKCDACGHAFEQFQSITAAPTKRCPACKKLKVKRLISAGAGLIFKGSGFYITDYRDQGYKDKAKADAGASAPSGGGDGDAGKASGGEPSSGGMGDKPATEAKPAGDAKPAPAAESKPAAEVKTASKSAAKGGGKKGK